MAQQIDIVANLLMKVDGAEAGLNKLKSKLSQLEMPKGLENSFKKSFSNLDGLFAKYKAQLKDGFNTKADISSFAKTGKQIEAEYDRISASISKLTGKDVSLKVDLTAINNLEKELEKLIGQKEKLAENIKGGLGLNKFLQAMQASDVGRKGTKVYDASNILQTSLGRGDIEKAKADVEGLIAELNRMSDTRKKALEARAEMPLNQIIQTLRAKVDDADQSMNKFGNDIKATSDNMAKMRTDQWDRVGKALADIDTTSNKATSGIKGLNGEAQAAAQNMYSMANQIEQLKTSTQYFFSLRNMLNLFKRGIREAVDTVKELDAAMTETAVVTKYSVGDMWAKLPEYTANANKLGATIQDMYESTTLYYQQGLNTEQAMSIATETMKMARIAGMEAAEATDMMTAALRGFNMEINEASAEHINDVYSNLAAKTASNTEELGTAMQRTASIAASAGMSFEGTAAFLAQAIETTREPAENLGTAMKTIVARFTELKKNPLEIAEVDGEEVSYNKIDTALQSIGVSLKDANGQFRDLDKVFLDISQKWDTLSQTQQRYIATTAAGSRQQSRFIAMMSNYERTMQLMGYANDSAGASQEQFGKTLESLEAKLNKFQNAWKEFLMGIMNDSWTKGIVDAGTKVLSVVNKLIDALSFGGKAKGIKSTLSILAAFSALKVTGRVANSLIGGLGGMLDPSVGFGKGLLGGASGMRQQVNAAQASAIYTPIVNAIRALPAQIKGAVAGTGEKSESAVAIANNKLLAQARSNIEKKTGFGKQYTPDEIVRQYYGLGEQQQRVLRNSMIGTSSKVERALLSRWETQPKEHQKAIKMAASNLKSNARVGTVAWSKYFDAISDPVAMQKALANNSNVDQATMQWINGMAESTQEQARTNIEEAYNRGKGRLATNAQEYQAGLDKIYSSMTEEQWTMARRKAWKDMNPTELLLQNKTGTVLLDRLGQFGAGISSAGLGLQSFGSLLSSSANPALQMFGSALTAVGGLLSSVGMAISGVVAGFNALVDSVVMKTVADGLSKILGAQISSGAATGILAGIAALTAIAVTAYKKHIKKIQDAGEQVVKKYKDANEKYTNSITDLKTWKEELPRLQQGVDINGNNVSLDTTDYERYREIISGIAEINPSIVEGYNAQGDAIIRNNNALDETIAKQKELQQLATEEYLDTQSLATLIRARNTTDSFKKDLEGSESIVQAHSLIAEMKRAGLGSLLESMGFDYDKMQATHNNPEIQRFVAENKQIAHQISAFYDQAGVDIDSHVSEKLADLTAAVEAENEDIQEVYNYLMTYGANKNLIPTGMSSNLQKSFNDGIKLIAKSRLTATGMQKAVGDLAKRYNVLSDANSQYNQIMTKVRAGQEEYSRTLNASDYKGQEYYNNLMRLAQGEQELADKTDILQDKIAHTNLAEFYTTEAKSALDFTNKKITDLTSGFAQLTNEISIAKNAYTDWQKELEGITSPEEGVNSYKQIYDEIFKETEDSKGVKHQYNIEAGGRPELFTGAAKILSADWLKGKDADQVAKKLKELQPLFREGQEGAVALGDSIKKALETDAEFDGGKFSDFFELKPDGSVGVKEGVNINDSVTEQLADYYDLNTAAFVAALQNATQYGINLMQSTADQRLAVVQDVRGSEGAKTRTYTRSDGTKEDIKDWIVSRDVLVEAFHSANVYNEKDISDGIKALRKEQGVITAERVLAAKNAKKLESEYGINKDNFLQVMGKFLDETQAQEKGEEYFGKDWWTEARQAEYQQIQEGLQSAYEDATTDVPDIASSVSNIESMLAAKLFADGNATNFSAVDELHRAINGNDAVVDTSPEKLAVGVKKDNLNKAEFDQYYADTEAAFNASKQLVLQLQRGLENTQEGTEQYELYSENLTKALKDFETLENIKNAADEYKKNKNWDTEDITDDVSVQERTNQVIASGWGNLLNNVPADILATPEAQAAMNVLAKTAYDPYLLQSDQLTEALSTLGLTWQDAIQAGIEAWPTGEDVGRKAEEKVQDVGDAVADATDESNMHLEALAMNTIPGLHKIIDWITGEVDDFVDGINNITPAPVSNPSTTITHDQQQGQSRTEQLKTIFISEGADKVEKEEDTVKDKADKGATHITKFKTENEGAVKKATDAGSETKTVKVKADTSGIDKAGSTPVAKPVIIDDKATPKIKQIDSAAKKSVTKTVSISPNWGSASQWIKTATINVKKTGATGPTGYTGLSNKIPYIHVPQAGSLAGGTKKGRTGPRNRGGLTLTGEKGYEIAWFPEESRSMILGANGPQMINLPKSAVVYNHEQSKEIMKKRKGIPAGSNWSGSLPTSTPIGGSGGGGGTTAKTVSKTANHVKKKASEAADAVKSVSVWWENIARKTEASQRKQDNNQKEFEKYLKEMRATLHMTGENMNQGGGGGDDYIKSIGETLGYYEAQLEKVTKELDNLANGKIPSSAKERKSKYGEEGYENLAKVSYKKGKKSKEEFVNLADYIKEEAGTFVIDQKALDAISSKEKRQAVKDAADKEINDRLSKKYKAEDEIQKAQEAIDKMGEELYETFFKWETELTKIWNITQKIEQTEARISQAKGYSDLLESQLSTGMATAGKEFAAQSLSAFRASLQQQSKQINLSFEALNQKKIDLSKLLSLDDEKKTLENVQKKIVEGIDDQSQIAKLQEELANKQAIVSGLEEKITKGDAAIASIDADIAETEPKTKKGKKKNKKKAQKKLNKLNIQKEETIKQKGEYEAQKAEAVKEYEAAKAAYDEAKSNTINDTERLGYEEYAKQLENNIAMQARAWDFMSANQFADGTLDVQFDSDTFDKAKEEGTITEEQGKQIQDYIKSITEGSKELSQQYADTTSLINDMYGSLDSLQDAWAGYAEELWQISDEQQRKEVDNLKKLSDSLSDTFKSLIDDVKRKLDQRRKQEDNAKTEQDISRKQQRLAALQADTSGGHQVEIAQLQQEIANDQQNYQRSLEDQLLDSLQQQADLAAQQRERQIALQEAMINEINNAALVNEWMNNPEEYKDKIYQAFCDANDYDKKPEALQAQLDEKFNTLFNGLLTNQDEQQIVTNEIKSLEGKVTEIKDELSQVVALQNAISQLSAAASQLSVTNSTTQAVTKPTGLTQSQTTAAVVAAATQQPVNQQESIPTANTAGDAYKAAIDTAHKKKTVSKDTFIDAVNKGKAAGYGVDQVARDLAEGDGKGGVTWEEVVKAAKKANYTKAQVSKWSKDKYLVAAVKKWSKFASGGLADYTGPAWLDGTPSKPELVLNSTDTKNFLALRDILSSAMNSMNTVSNSYGGDTLYEININVDKIEKDYDVDRVVEKVKKEITKGAGYRNVTQVRNLR